MAIVGWYCPAHKTRVPLGHFEHCNAVHPDFAAAVLADRGAQDRDGVRVSHGLGCVRKYALESTADVWIDPTASNATLGGAAWHRMMQGASNHPELCEVDVAGVIAGIQVAGRIDRLHPPTAISDWKTTSDWAERYLKQPKDQGGGMKPEHLAQMSLYAELVEQTQGWRPLHGVVWYRMQKAQLPFAELLWPLEKTLAFTPHESGYTVLDLLRQAASVHGGQATWSDLPLVGERIRFGTKTGCDYCAVRDHCWQQARGAPF